jgi:hypothetical protein
LAASSRSCAICLTDKNGKEIYEGSILEEKTGGEKMRWVVRYEEKYCTYVLQNPDDANNFNTFDWMIVQAGRKHGKGVFEVIGDIYSNPEPAE